MPASSIVDIPPGRDIAPDQRAIDNSIVGSGSLAIDQNCDSTVENYSLTIYEAGTTEPDEKTSWLATGIPFMQINFVIRGSAASGHTIEALLFTGILMPPLCSPMDYRLNFFGISLDNPATGRTEGGEVVLTNPAAGIEKWNAEWQSAPLAFPPAHTINVCDSVAIGGVSSPPDTDSDGISNECDNDADPDGDGFSNGVEASAGTDRAAACATSSTHNAWPADINNDGFSDIGDIVAIASSFGRAVPPGLARHNVAPDPPDAFVDITDIVRVAALFGRSCP